MEHETGQVVANAAVATYSALWVFQAVAAITFTMRIISRSFITHDLGWEDTIMALGWAVALTGTILMTLSIHAIIQTTDATTAEDSEAKTAYAFELSLFAGALGPNATFLPKISVALLLCRLLQPRALMKAVLVVPSILGFVGGGIGSAIITFVQCSPIPGQWDPERYHPKCWDPSIMVNYFSVWAALSAALDILYAIYPATIFWKMQLSTRRKLAISILMGLGLISGAVGIYKTSLTPLLGRDDQGGDIALASTHIVTMWTTIEADIIISAACIPLTRPVWRVAMSYGGRVWEGAKMSVGLRPTAVDLAVESRRDHGRYFELSGRMPDINLIIAENRERHTSFRDDVEMRCSPRG